jgi:hypothetical protein
MMRLPESVSAWGSPEFHDVLKRELERWGPSAFPLQAGLSTSSYALDDGFSVMVIGASEADGFIQARVGIFYSGIIAGCSCADDPTPVEAQSEYCEVQLAIDKLTAETVIGA